MTRQPSRSRRRRRWRPQRSTRRPNPAPMRSPSETRRMRLADRTTRQLTAARPILAVPVGSCEQHGPHLPLGTDTIIADALGRPARGRGAGRRRRPAARRHGERRARRVRRHPVDRHGGHAAVIVELARSADWAAGLVLVNGHGGNARRRRRGRRHAARRGPRDRRVVAADPRRRRPRRAHRDVADARDRDPTSSTRPPRARQHGAAGRARARPRAGGVAAVSPNGVLGDPRAATLTRASACSTCSSPISSPPPGARSATAWTAAAP